MKIAIPVEEKAWIQASARSIPITDADCPAGRAAKKVFQSTMELLLKNREGEGAC